MERAERPGPALRAVILGSAAGGGVPQWNCRCPVCRLAWAGDPRVARRTQSSLAVTVDGERWLVVNASPDLREQIGATPVLQPRRGLRQSPISAVLLTNGDVDHVAGLLSLREGHAFVLYATPTNLASIAANRVFDVMAPSVVERREASLETPFEPIAGLRATLFAVPGKVALWLEDGTPEIGSETETTVGVLLEAGGRRLAYVPGCAHVTPALRDRLDGVDALLFDGTVLDDDDLIRAEVGTKTGWRMGHVPMRGPRGSVAAFADADIRQRVFIHVNNTNPALIDGSSERHEIEAAGWTIGRDGDTIEP